MSMPEDVRLVLSGWMESGCQIALVGQSQGREFALRCTVKQLTDGDATLAAQDGHTVVLHLSAPTLEYRYSQPREIPLFVAAHNLAAAQQTASCLTFLSVCMDVDPDTAGDHIEPESLSLVELG